MISVGSNDGRLLFAHVASETYARHVLERINTWILKPVVFLPESKQFIVPFFDLGSFCVVMAASQLSIIGVVLYWGRCDLVIHWSFSAATLTCATRSAQRDSDDITHSAWPLPLG